jgi:hypothetical protein
VRISKYLKLEPEGGAFKVQTLGSQLPGKNKKEGICQHFYHFRINRLKFIAWEVLSSMLV